MTLSVAARIAGRELRGGLKGFRVFLACLALGVGAIAAVGRSGRASRRGWSARARRSLAATRRWS
jgi:putative ABC transport system permease protein